MDLRIVTQPQQGASHATLLAAALAAREAGFSGFFRSDHVLRVGAGTGLPGPSESVASLAALAAQVPDIRLGAMVMSATFRHPSMLGIAAATIDDISGGRLELGLGAGWFESEHAAYGLPLGASFAERFDRLTEQLEIITGLWGTPTGQTFSYAGRHYALDGAPGLPKPVQTGRDGRPAIPIIIGGLGPRRTPALAARFADEFNVGYSSVDVTHRQVQRVRAACESQERDPDSLVYSVAHTVICGRDDTEIERRAAAIGRSVQQLREAGSPVGTPAQLIDTLGRWAEIGIGRCYLQILDLADLEHLALLGAEVLPRLG